MMADGNPLKLKKTSSAPEEVHEKIQLQPWNILIVDDDEEVHSVTRLILSKIKFQNRSINIQSAHSASEAKGILENPNDIACILLDVVMETDDAGLILTKTIREKLGNRAIRIVLRTGQPGQAPEERVIVDYDINDYKSKSELTAQKLFTTVVAALRSYETIRSLEKSQKGLQKILESTDSLFDVQSLRHFSSGVLMQLSAFLGCKPNGALCAQADSDDAGLFGKPCNGLNIVASAGEYEECMTCKFDSDCAHEEMLVMVRRALDEKKSQYSNRYAALYLDAKGVKASVALLHGAGEVDDNDRFLLEIFSSKISLALANAINYSKKVSAEEAAVTDFLTGLPNRRHLITLGQKLLSNCRRSNSLVAVALMDIDHFKKINDTYGHDAGDIVLQRISSVFRERFRESDVVARFGGEEFCAIATSVTADGAYELFEGIRRDIENEKVEISGAELNVTISIGVVIHNDMSLDDLISEADIKLYEAKHTGRNCTKIKVKFEDQEQ